MRFCNIKQLWLCFVDIAGTDTQSMADFSISDVLPSSKNKLKITEIKGRFCNKFLKLFLIILLVSAFLPCLCYIFYSNYSKTPDVPDNHLGF